MDHPNIARIFDGGVDGADRPYVVMEYLAGKAITAYAAANALPLRDRLALVAAVARAVHHAHQKGVIHRDLKPGNILVTEVEGRPVPKIIDFGVARGTAAGDARYTDHGVVVGTLEYMSPEQADPATAEDVDTRSDVYAIGVLLYELLTGRTPVTRDTAHRLRLLELLRRIREVDPPPPSCVDGGPVPKATIPRDLDWVVARALEKDPARRYESAAAFADDLDRLGSNEPVSAAPPGRVYRCKKFVLRNRGAVLAGGLVAAAVIAGAGATAWQAYRATVAEADARDKLGRAELAEADAKRETEKAKAAEAAAVAEQGKAVAAAKAAGEASARAEAARGDTDAFAEFMRKHVLEVARTEGNGDGRGIDVTVGSALATAEPEMARAFAGRPRAEADARRAIGTSFQSLGNYAAAERNLARAAELMAAEYGRTSRQAVVARVRWATVLPHLNRAAEAVPVLEAELHALTAELGPGDVATIRLRGNLVSVYRHTGDLAAAVRTAEFNRTLAEKHLPPNDPLLDNIRTNLALLYHPAGRPNEARKLAEAAIAGMGPDRKPDDAVRILAEVCVATWYANSKTPTEAIRRFETLLPKLTRTYGEDSLHTIAALNTLALVHGMKGETAKGVSLSQTALKAARRALPTYHHTRQSCMAGLSWSLVLDKNATELRSHLAAWSQELEAAPQPPSAVVVKHYADVARTAAFAEDPDRAERFGKLYLAAGGKDPARRTDVHNILEAVQKSKKNNGSKKLETAPPPRPSVGPAQATKASISPDTIRWPSGVTSSNSRVPHGFSANGCERSTDCVRHS